MPCGYHRYAYPLQVSLHLYDHELQILILPFGVIEVAPYLGINDVTTNPSNAESTVIRASAETAAKKMVSLLDVMAMMAAMKNVLSPISETTMTDRPSTKPWRKPG